MRITPEELKKRNERARAVLKSSEEDDPEEQKETGDFLMAALAAGRESCREEPSEAPPKTAGEKIMQTETRKLSYFERHPELKISKEQLQKRKAKALETLRRWVENGDEKEQCESGDFLMKALAEARESSREERK